MQIQKRRNTENIYLCLHTKANDELKQQIKKKTSCKKKIRRKFAGVTTVDKIIKSSKIKNDLKGIKCFKKKLNNKVKVVHITWFK